MTETKSKIPLIHAQTIAGELLTEITPYCDIANVVGSVRRKVPEPGDIEICCIPKITMREDRDLFGEVEHTVKIVHPEFERIVKGWGTVIKGQPSGRYMQVEVERRFLNMDWMISIDLFMPQPHDYFRQLAIRTGSAEYAKRFIADAWVKKGYRGTPDGLRLQRECYSPDQKKWFIQKEYAARPTLPPVWASEVEFFRWLNVQYLAPELRNL